MIHTLCILVFCVSIWSLSAQEAMVINDNAFVVIDGNAFVVLDNPNPNALLTTGAGGNIISENENDIIKWNIGTNIGAYTIPWTTRPVIQGGNGQKIPLVVNILNPGSGFGAPHILFSTYETNTDNNLPYPTGVTNMNSMGADVSLQVVDRFWQINSSSYANRPDVIMTFNYDPSANEIGGTNTISEPNLLAQRWNSTINDWEGLLFGANDAPNDRVLNVVANSTDFFENWTLSDQLVPLPVELEYFKHNCHNKDIELEWQTSSERNNDYFILEKTRDMVSFELVAEINGAGTTTSPTNYAYIDPSNSNYMVYYRLSQIDYDGVKTQVALISTDCFSNEEYFQTSYIGNQLIIHTDLPEINKVTLSLIDISGRVVLNKQNAVLHPGKNVFNLNKHFSRGVYYLNIVNESFQHSIKLNKVN